ISGKPARTPT
nr:RecName: Full=Cytochrome c oxidase subunit 8B, mitochondrial; AltName: Full=Cytochrome c oxidase polypeptide VIII-liver/heart; AltName: Full=Cytochrome c oxidase subunit 8-1; AltName: Full=Cytochrome c oxidase subunit 8H [Oryctolagus cuniculus]